MAEEEPAALADALNAINRANLRGLATADQWTDLVNEYFVYAEEEEGHEEEEGGETEPLEPEEDPPDPVDVRVNTTRRGRAANSSPQPKSWNNVSRCSSSLQARKTCCSWACTTPSQTTIPCCPPGGRVQGGRRRGSTSAVITCWATKPCAGTPSNSSTSKYYGLANNHCSIAGGG